jgi:hypothetical protein
VRLAREQDLRLHSFAFPRNRVGHLDVLHEFEFACYRGPEPVWYERARVPPALRRIGHLTDVLTARRPPVVTPQLTASGVWNIPGSMMYFPMHGPRRYLPVSVRVGRAVKGIERAASERAIFHLWFHPTNLADESERMFAGLRSIFERVAALRAAGALEATPMGALVPVASPAVGQR